MQLTCRNTVLGMCVKMSDCECVEDRIVEIKERLEKVTGEFWIDNEAYCEIWNNEGQFVISYDANVDEDNIDFITNSPEDIQFLLDEVERLQEELNEYKDKDKTCYTCNFGDSNNKEPCKSCDDYCSGWQPKVGEAHGNKKG